MKRFLFRIFAATALATTLGSVCWTLPAAAQSPTDQPTMQQTPLASDTPVATETASSQTVTTTDSGHVDYGIFGLAGLLGLLGLLRRGSTETVDYRRTPGP